MFKHFTSEELKPISESKVFGNFPSPWDMSRIKPELHIYGKDKPNVIITHDISADKMVATLLSEDLLPTDRFIIVTHGYKSDIKTEWLQRLRGEIIDKNNKETVAILNWGKGADPGHWGANDYKQAAANTQAVGEWLALYATAIDSYFNKAEQEGNELENNSQRPSIWGIGHSLGAHLMGKAGRVSGVFTRITGLDPAGPAFETINHDKRLNKNDAKLVDVIHTDGYGIVHFGTLVPLGTIDFYPSYGWSQPVRSTHEYKPLFELTYYRKPTKQEKNFGAYLTESHSRAVDYFIWSIANKGKFATFHKLDGTPDVDKTVHRIRFDREAAEMGYYADNRVNNIEAFDQSYQCYYIHLNSSEPWL